MKVNKTLAIICILLTVFLFMSIASGVSEANKNALQRSEYQNLKNKYDLLCKSPDTDNNDSRQQEIDALKSERDELSSELDAYRDISDKNQEIKKLDELIKSKQDELDRLTKTVEPLQIEEQRKLTEGITVYEDNYVKINYLQIQFDSRYSGYNYTIVFLIENKTDIVLTARYRTLALDGEEVDDCMGTDKISPQSRGKLNIIAMSVNNRYPSYVSGTIEIDDEGGTLIKIPYSPESTIYKNDYDITFVNVKVK